MKIINTNTGQRLSESLGYREYSEVIYTAACVWLKKSEVPRGEETLSWICFIVKILKPWRFFTHSVTRDALFRGLLMRGLLLSKVTLNNEVDAEINKRVLDYYAKKIGMGKFQCKVDESFMGESALLLYEKTRDKKLLPLINEMAKYYKNQFSISQGAIPYHEGCSHICVDSIGMICPFLARYSVMFNDPMAMEYACRQIDDFCRYGIEEKTGLPYHGYDSANGNVPIGLFGWGRGAGWFAMGLIDTLLLLPCDSKKFLGYSSVVVKLYQTLMIVECPDGGWSSLLTDNGRTRDGSASAMLGYFIMRGVEGGIIEESSGIELVRRSIKALIKNTLKNGEINYVQGDCLALDRMSSCYKPNAYGQGMAVSLTARYNDYVQRRAL